MLGNSRSLSILRFYMNQRVGKSRVYPSGSWSYVYDRSGNMIHENWGTSYSEYVYLGGHRIAMVVPSEWTQPGGTGCSVLGRGTFQTAAVNLGLVFLPAFIVIIFAYREENRRKIGTVTYFFSFSFFGLPTVRGRIRLPRNDSILK